MALPTDQQPSQVVPYEKSLLLQSRLMNGGESLRRSNRADSYVRR